MIFQACECSIPARQALYLRKTASVANYCMATTYCSQFQFENALVKNHGIEFAS